MIIAIILAAGKSERMGRPKLILPIINGKTIIEHVIECVKSSKVDEVLVILGHEPHNIIPYVQRTNTPFIVNFFYEYGMTSSFKRGIMEIADRADAALLVLGDQPLISTELIDQIIDIYEHTSALIVSPKYKGKKGHPVLFDKKVFTDIINLPWYGIIRTVVHKYSLQHVTFDWEKSVIIDVDTPEDYRKLVEIIKRSHKKN
ncbi:MAG: nucleotidyltransferase family protein [Candidatus Odinarchaeota archaeon]|nr:nucleotidyltransferase family protein [Candidatus Odinarchaeota archaeon]